MLERRHFLVGGVGAALAPMLCAREATTANSGELSGLLEQLLREDFQRRPEAATLAGFDKGDDRGLRSKLSDDSADGRAAHRAAVRDQIRRLEAVGRHTLTEVELVTYDTVLYLKRGAAAAQSFDFGGSGYIPSPYLVPYVVSQRTGAYQSVPDFLHTRHPIDDAADADAYLSRMSGYADQLSSNTERMRYDATLGVVPPDFLLDATLANMERLLVSPGQAAVVQSVARRALAKGLPGGHEEGAERIYTRRILPALQAQFATVKRLRASATSTAGIWKAPRGAEFYACALSNTTTTALSPDEVHRLGLERAQSLSSQLDALLKAQGMSSGSVGARLAALSTDPTQVFANTDDGKTDAVAYCNRRLDALRPRLSQAFKRVPEYSFEVKRGPFRTEADVAAVFTAPNVFDRGRPDLAYFNLYNTAEWPKFWLPTTVFHENVPGHQLEASLAVPNPHLAPIRKQGGLSGHGEGWALYAEQLADELGAYDDDPIGRLGYLKFQLSYANRCVVDTGIHHRRWTRDKAIRYLVEQQGDPMAFATREVERYCAAPGQACCFALGHAVINGLREKTQRALGARFDIRNFHDAMLTSGRLPLDVLQSAWQRWMETQHRA